MRRSTRDLFGRLQSGLGSDYVAFCLGAVCPKKINKIGDGNEYMGNGRTHPHQRYIYSLFFRREIILRSYSSQSVARQRLWTVDEIGPIFSHIVLGWTIECPGTPQQALWAECFGLVEPRSLLDAWKS